MDAAMHEGTVCGASSVLGWAPVPGATVMQSVPYYTMQSGRLPSQSIDEATRTVLC
eukprot:m.760368 g.760368  ORF g.760368 m.760368 type:complete len:56 (+) comp23200_c1_seq2:1220-1387(+)